MRTKGYKCYNIKCGACVGKSLCGEGEDTALMCDSRLVNRQTNADRIRAMSDEELGQVFGAWCDASDCANCPELTGDFMRGKMFGVCPLSRKMYWSEWLKRPAEEVQKDA